MVNYHHYEVKLQTSPGVAVDRCESVFARRWQSSCDQVGQNRDSLVTMIFLTLWLSRVKGFLTTS
jgi:hypothetical protein